MTFDNSAYISDLQTLPRMPAWITASSGSDAEDAVFRAGAALGHLHLVVSQEAVPKPLFYDRLALQSAEACVVFSGRPERQRDLRDAAHLLRPGDLPGPAGNIYLAWQRAVAGRLSVKTLAHAFPRMDAARTAFWLDAGQGAPVSRAAMVMEAVLTDQPRDEVPALILADAALAQALGWDHLVPLLAAGLRRADLRKRGADLHLACHRAVTASAIAAVRIAADLARRAAVLQAVAPKLRAKGAGHAVAMFLTQDAVAPAALPLPDRAARRLCGRLVTLGAVRELTGRDTFRLYGV